MSGIFGLHPLDLSLPGILVLIVLLYFWYTNKWIFRKKTKQ